MKLENDRLTLFNDSLIPSFHIISVGILHLKAIDAQRCPRLQLAYLETYQDSLETLVVTSAAVESLGVFRLGTWAHLTDIILMKNRISDLTPLAHLPRLTTLNLAFNQIERLDGLDSIGTLTWLCLDNNLLKSANQLSHLNGTALAFVSLINNQFSDAGLEEAAAVLKGPQFGRLTKVFLKPSDKEALSVRDLGESARQLARSLQKSMDAIGDIQAMDSELQALQKLAAERGQPDDAARVRAHKQ